MATTGELETEGLWRRLGLGELRAALERISALEGRFEQALRALPPCTSCAKVAMLEDIRGTGRRLSGEAASLSALAETLKEAVAASLRAQEALTAQAPTPCRCASGQCVCHDE